MPASRPATPTRHCALVDGQTIVQEAVAEVDYVHIELDRHDILLAEGLPAESYLDVGNRSEFENGNGPMVLHPAFAPLAHEAARAPFMIAGPALDAVRARLAARVDTRRKDILRHPAA